jgi:hypothetical protein
MKKILLIFCLLLFTVKLFGQQFSQYNTGTLYDSFENPSQKAFVTDTSKKFAFNFFVPNFNADLFLNGNAQATLKSRIFLNMYNNSKLVIDKGSNNHANLNINAYSIMLKMFSSFDGDTEMGFSAQTKIEGHSLFSDETAAAFNGTQTFTNTVYNNIFNDNYTYQAYHQLSFTYREKYDKHFSFGVKLSMLLGIQYQKLDITSSAVAFDKLQDSASVALKGTYHESFIPGNLSARDFLPVFRNPGASITIGTAYVTEDNFNLQANVKDLGFIHWSSRSRIYNFDNVGGVHDLSGQSREDSIYSSVNKIVRHNVIPGSFTTPIDGRAEFSAMKSFWIDDNRVFKYSPTLIASKDLFDAGFTGALVNPIQYQKYVLTLTTTYDDLKIFTLGMQFMIKTANLEFYIGSDKLAQTAGFVSQGLNANSPKISENSSFTGGDFFLGFAMKFGPVIEHPMNSSTIPTGEKGFIGRLINRLFKTAN